jgi:hypothetical protein
VLQFNLYDEFILIVIGTRLHASGQLLVPDLLQDTLRFKQIAAKATIDLKLRAVFSQRGATPLKHLRRPPCSMRYRGFVGMCEITVAMPHPRRSLAARHVAGLDVAGASDFLWIFVAKPKRERLPRSRGRYMRAHGVRLSALLQRRSQKMGGRG